MAARDAVEHLRNVMRDEHILQKFVSEVDRGVEEGVPIFLISHQVAKRMSLPTVFNAGSRNRRWIVPLLRNQVW